MPTHRAAIYLHALPDAPSSVQRAHAEDLARERGWTIGDYFVDAAGSELKQRLVVRDMFAAARAGRFDVLVVAGAGHLCKSTREFVTVLSELSELGVAFASATEHALDTTTNPALVALVDALELFERQAYRVHIKRSLAKARRKGVKNGRKPREFDEVAARAMRRRGLSIRTIAAELGVPQATVARRTASKRETVSAAAKTPAKVTQRRARAEQSTFGFAATP